MRIFSMLIAMLLIGSVSFAKNKISGTVKDAGNGDPIIGAVLNVKGTSIGGVTDYDGNFTLSVEPGVYDVEVRYTSYSTYTIEKVDATKGDVTSIAVQMSTDSKKLEELVVKAKANRESEKALLIERRKSTEVIQKIGSQEMSRKGVSDAAEGLNKVVGVSSSDNSTNKVTMVRGLGDRYNMVTLNGLPIPSSNPNLKVMPLDIFPTGVIKNVAVSKSYSPQYYGDVAGGAIDITTKDYAEDGFVTVGVRLGANTITTGKTFLTSGTGLSTTTGFDRSRRAMPDAVAATKQYDSKAEGVTSSPFNTKFTPKTISASPNYGINVSTGNFFKMAKQGSGIGYYASLTHRNASRYSPGILALYNAQQDPIYNYNTNNYEYTANTTGLINVSYRINNKNTVGVTALMVNDANDTWIEARGTDKDLGPILSRRNNYVQNTLWTTQLLGTHDVSKNGKFVWGLSYNTLKGSMPDRTQNTFRISQTPNGEVYTFAFDATSNNQRFFSNLDDKEYAGKAEYIQRYNDKEKGLIEVKGGVNARYKSRVFNARAIDMKISSGAAVDLNDVDAQFSNDKLGDGTKSTYKYIESYYAPNDYEATLLLGGAYASAEFKYGKVRIMPGLRAEYSDQVIYFKKASDTYSRDFRDTSISGVNLMPALTVKYEVNKRSNLMFAASRTITRPQFVEVGPFRYNLTFGTQEVEGNPLLRNGTNYNADLKYEFYPTKSEIISVNLLGKYMVDPIEMVVAASVDPLLTYVNTDRAYVAGVELEYLKNLGNLFGSKSKVLQNSNLGFNASYLYTQIQIDDEKALDANIPITVTNKSRPLMGASPYLINFDYNYKHYWNKDKSTSSQFTLAYNVYGRKVVAAGSQGAGDIYQMPVNTLDFTVMNKFKNGLGANLSVRNLLNPSIVQNQLFGEDKLEVVSYKRGIDVNLTINYTIK
ncbi:MAG: outer membrane beta-barrel protein [Flavipsychrobacter sp.]